MENKIKEIIADIFGVDAENLGDETSRADISDWDSLNHLRMVTALEEAFNIKLSMNEIEQMQSLGAIMTIFREHA